MERLINAIEGEVKCSLIIEIPGGFLISLSPSQSHSFFMPIPPSQVIIKKIQERKVSPSLAPDGWNTSKMGRKPER